MQYDLLIERTLRNAQGILRANLPPAKNLPDDQAVQSLRAIVRTPQVREVLERGTDTALCFVLRAVNRILSDDDQPDRTKINRLWDVLDEPKFNRASLGPCGKGGDIDDSDRFRQRWRPGHVWSRRQPQPAGWQRDGYIHDYGRTCAKTIGTAARVGPHPRRDRVACKSYQSLC